MNKILRTILSRTSLILLFLLIQLAAFFFLVDFVSQYAYVEIIFRTFSVLIVIYLMIQEENPMYKISWIVPILIFPLFGGLFYLFYKRINFSKKVINRQLQIAQEHSDKVEDFINPLGTKDSHYLENIGWPTYQNTQTKFLDSGETLFSNLIKDLKQAKKYILIEYFIIKLGYVWSSILEVLIDKVHEGVEVKIIYDDFGSHGLPYYYPRHLKKLGIEAIKFNPMRMHINFAMNYRDHRKIVVIDGVIGYTGGINIGDEYINKKSPFGHWHDAGIRLEGDAVWSLVLTFLENYRFNSQIEIDYNKYKVLEKKAFDGYVIPFPDSPLDKELSSKNIYLSLINAAQKSVWVTSPYLIIDHELLTALKLSAKSGVDVKIIIPHIPDKKLVLMVTESYVPELVESGVKVYRYKPGFIHSKLMIVDGMKALIGTTNLDFRSLYLHFENNVYLQDSSAITDMVHYFENTIKSSILTSDMKKRNFFYRVIQTLLRGFSPLL